MSPKRTVLPCIPTMSQQMTIERARQEHVAPSAVASLLGLPEDVVRDVMNLQRRANEGRKNEIPAWYGQRRLPEPRRCRCGVKCSQMVGEVCLRCFLEGAAPTQ